ncbi:hypothetical protein EVAR_10045_1 [Eumeta japonica]|uniref:Uncharacterized protein n=1 Tax=Eumeta variegata TaxID=151549 RepID=A0A4C1TR52_EUMVA|nr:hypothetical protein EVAR_10045_1 [Eumeta japonica]
MNSSANTAVVTLCRRRVLPSSNRTFLTHSAPPLLRGQQRIYYLFLLFETVLIPTDPSTALHTIPDTAPDFYFKLYGLGILRGKQADEASQKWSIPPIDVPTPRGGLQCVAGLLLLPIGHLMEGD